VESEPFLIRGLILVCARFDICMRHVARVRLSQDSYPLPVRIGRFWDGPLSSADSDIGFCSSFLSFPLPVRLVSSQGVRLSQTSVRVCGEQSTNERSTLKLLSQRPLPLPLSSSVVPFNISEYYGSSIYELNRAIVYAVVPQLVFCQWIGWQCSVVTFDVLCEWLPCHSC
jgi:hypothetical protein